MSNTISDNIINENVKKSINKQILLFSIVYLSLQLIFILFVTWYYTSSKESAVDTAVYEYQEVDYTYLCKLTNCEYTDIVDTKDDFIYLNNKLVDTYTLPSPLFTIQNVSIYPMINLGLNLDSKIGATFILRIPIFIKVLIFVSLLSWVFTIMSFYYYLKKVAKTSTLLDLINFAGKEAQLSNKNMVILTENIHHEVKTPIAVINSKTEYLKEYYYSLRAEVLKNIKEGVPTRKLDRMIIGCDLNCGTCSHNKNNKCGIISAGSNTKVDEAFDMIDSYISAVYVVLERMKNFKQIKYSNGDKNMYDIANTALQTLKLHYKGLFSYKIDSSFKNFKMTETGLKNEDVLNILLNHIKNSLEAKATMIILQAVSFNKDILAFQIVDNGNGVPSEVKDRIYDINFSTKSGNGDVRGIGMYISRSLLRTVGGDEYIKESSSMGTVIEILIPVQRKDKDD